MKLIKKLLTMIYTREVITVLIVFIAIFGIHQTSWLFIAKVMLDVIIMFISSLIVFIHVEYKLYGYKNGVANAISGVSFFIWLLSIGVLLSISCVYFMDAQPSYTKHYVYTPVSVIKDSNEVSVIGKNVILKSDKISDYLSNDLKICKDEQYSAAKIRLSDKIYICK